MYTLQGKPDQHATCIPRLVRVWSQTICISCGQRVATFRLVPTRLKQTPTLEEFLATADRLAQLSPQVTSSFLPHDHLSVGERGFGHVVTQLYRLTGPIYQYVIGTFNTCSQGPTHRSLTDTGGGYNHLRASPGLRLSNINIASRKNVIWNNFHRLMVFRPLDIYQSLYLRLAMANVIQILAMSSRVTRKVFIMHTVPINSYRPNAQSFLI
jgi:hypothetical protein